MESKLISDNQISASSQLDGNHSAIQARLHSKADGSNARAWSALTNDPNQWLQVDLGSATRVTRVATQGSNAYNESVTKYKLQYSDDGVTFQFYKDVGDTSAKVFARCQRNKHLFTDSWIRALSSYDGRGKFGEYKRSETEKDL